MSSRAWISAWRRYFWRREQERGQKSVCCRYDFTSLGITKLLKVNEPLGILVSASYLRFTDAVVKIPRGMTDYVIPYVYAQANQDLVVTELQMLTLQKRFPELCRNWIHHSGSENWEQFSNSFLAMKNGNHEVKSSSVDMVNKPDYFSQTLMNIASLTATLEKLSGIRECW